jgi:presenilin-like A22 family membrane protease
MKNKKFKGAKLVSYYNLVVSACFVIGAFTLMAFSGEVNVEDSEGTLMGLIFLSLFGAFCGFSAVKYLRRQKIGRVCIAVCFIVQIIYSILGLISTYRATDSAPIINVVMLIIGFSGIWYMTTKDAKEWIVMKS